MVAHCTDVHLREQVFATGSAPSRRLPGAQDCFGDNPSRPHSPGDEEAHPLALDPSNFRALFEQHSAFVWRVLRRHGVQERELEDACQEVFLVVHSRLSDFEGRSSLRTWLYGIAVRVALNARRKLGRRREQLEAVPAEVQAEADQDELTARRETLTLIERALTELDQDKREVFALYELEGMTMAEVASTLAIPENTALYRLYAARAELRAWLRHHELRTRARVASEARRTLP